MLVWPMRQKHRHWCYSPQSQQALQGRRWAVPIGAFIAALIGAEFGKFVHRMTPLDIIVTPATTLIIGMAVAGFISPAIDQLMISLGQLIMWAVDLSPIVMSIIVAIAMGLMLTLPISSAAIAISLGLGGLAAGAATVGCAAQMIGFAVMSYRDNGIGGAIACGLGTSMIPGTQYPKNPKIWLPPTLAGAVLAPFATAILVWSISLQVQAWVHQALSVRLAHLTPWVSAP